MGFGPLVDKITSLTNSQDGHKNLRQERVTVLPQKREILVNMECEGIHLTLHNDYQNSNYPFLELNARQLCLKAQGKYVPKNFNSVKV